MSVTTTARSVEKALKEMFAGTTTTGTSNLLAPFRGALGKICTSLTRLREARCHFPKDPTKAVRHGAAPSVMSEWAGVADRLLEIACSFPQSAPVEMADYTASVLDRAVDVVLRDCEAMGTVSGDWSGADNQAVHEMLYEMTVLRGSLDVYAEENLRSEDPSQIAGAAAIVVTLLAAASLLTDNHFTRLMEMSERKDRFLAPAAALNAARGLLLRCDAGDSAGRASDLGRIPLGSLNPEAPTADPTGAIAAALVADPAAAHDFIMGLTGEQTEMFERRLSKEAFARLEQALQSAFDRDAGNDSAAMQHAPPARIQQTMSRIATALLEPVPDARWVRSLSSQQRETLSGKGTPEHWWALVSAEASSGVRHAAASSMSETYGMLTDTAFAKERAQDMSAREVVDMLLAVTDQQVAEVAGVLASLDPKELAALRNEVEALDLAPRERDRVLKAFPKKKTSSTFGQGRSAQVHMRRALATVTAVPPFEQQRNVDFSDSDLEEEMEVAKFARSSARAKRGAGMRKNSSTRPQLNDPSNCDTREPFSENQDRALEWLEKTHGGGGGGGAPHEEHLVGFLGMLLGSAKVVSCLATRGIDMAALQKVVQTLRDEATSNE
jgi:hypothetical protein